jgi:hypothetical protein
MYAGRERSLVAAFHNSLTLLDAELEGRSFGGGVLELVPSEIARLSVPFPNALDEKLPELDSLYRHQSTGQVEEAALIERTNELVSSTFPELSGELLTNFEDARRALQARRLSRNR